MNYDRGVEHTPPTDPWDVGLTPIYCHYLVTSLTGHIGHTSNHSLSRMMIICPSGEHIAHICRLTLYLVQCIRFAFL